jgi:hypothetical protein
MAASYQSVRHDRRYEVDSRGVAEFELDRALRRFIPWCAVNGIEFEHKPQHKQVRWSVRAAHGDRIRPKLEYLDSLECYSVAIRAWREVMPHACRSHFARGYRKVRRAAALVHLLWIIPALLVYTVLGMGNVLREDIPYGAIGRLSTCAAVLFVLCLFQNLLFLKELRLGFDRWYALVEASDTEPKSDLPVPSNALLRWMFRTRPPARAEESITAEERAVYCRWEIGLLLPFFLFAPLLTYASYLAPTWAASLFHHEIDGTRFLVQPSTAFRPVLALLLGISTSTITLDGLYRALLRDRYRRFVRYCAERNGFEARRFFVCLAVTVFAGSALCLLAGVTSFSRFTDVGIEIRLPLSLHTSFYGYARVKSIERRATFRAPIGNTVQRPHYVILFDDGRSWSSREGLRHPEPDVDFRIAQLVSHRSKRPIIKQP